MNTPRKKKRPEIPKTSVAVIPNISPPAGRSLALFSPPCFLSSSPSIHVQEKVASTRPPVVLQSDRHSRHAEVTDHLGSDLGLLPWAVRVPEEQPPEGDVAAGARGHIRLCQCRLRFPAAPRLHDRRGRVPIPKAQQAGVQQLR